MKVLITRIDDSGKQTLGVLYVLNDRDEIQFECPTLELPWRDNKTSISCIPEGEYKVVKRTSARFKEHFHVLDVENRSYILIHAGNYYTDIRGCILVGSDMKDINRDGILDLVESKKTMGKLLKILPKEFTLKVTKSV